MMTKNYKYILKETEINNKKALNSRIKLHVYASRVFQNQFNKMKYPKKFNKLTLLFLNICSGENSYVIPCIFLIGGFILVSTIWINLFLLLELGIIFFVLSLLFFILKISYKKAMTKMTMNLNGEMYLTYDGKSIVYSHGGDVHSWLIENIFNVCIFNDGITIIFNKSNIYFNLLSSQFVEEDQYVNFVENIISDVDNRRIISY